MNQPSLLRVCVYGLGAIGGAVARAVLETETMALSGVITDTDPAKAGRDVRPLLRLRGVSGVLVSGDAAQVLAQGLHDVVIHTTGSRLPRCPPSSRWWWTPGFRASVRR